jgi:hypothetical protein
MLAQNWTFLWGLPLYLITASPALDELDPQSALTVRAEVVPGGPRFVGQGFELRVSVNADDQRPEIHWPRINGADTAVVSTTFTPLSSSAIGSFVSGSNRFVTRSRVVPRRVGILEIPAIRASIGGRSGHSQPLRVTILPVPPEGRPPEFLGGIGNFTLDARVSPDSTRVGQEVEFRITVKGPAAPGMTALPTLDRFEQLSIAPTITPLTDEATIEPLERTFSYRIRPTKPGQAVLPPVKISAFDPASKRYLSKVTQGIPLRVVAVPAFDPSTLESFEGATSPGAMDDTLAVIAASGAAGTLAIAAFLYSKRVRSSRARTTHVARRFAHQFALELEGREGTSANGGKSDLEPVDGARRSAPIHVELAQRITDGLIRYLELATDRPPGAITPIEARMGVIACTKSQRLGDRAQQLVAMCDGQRFGFEFPSAEKDVRSMIEAARLLFRKLSQPRFGSIIGRAGPDAADDDRLNGSLSRANEKPPC